MSISNGHLRYKRHIKQEDGSYKLVSHWTSAETVELANGLTLEESQIELTQAEYDALSEEEKMNGAEYFITDAESGSGAVGVDITLEEYEALSEEEKNNGTIYFVEDESEIMGANNIPYDNSVSKMEAKSVQAAIDENAANISNTNKTVETNTADIAENAAAITQLNSDLNPTELTTNGLVLGEYTQSIYDGYGYCQIGKLVIINLAVTFNSATTPNTMFVLSGLPKPLVNVQLATNWGGTTATVNSEGKLSMAYNTTGQSTVFSGAYIAQ